jgi:hypothetical protein
MPCRGPRWSPQEYQADFDELCSQIDSTYAYFDTKAMQWSRVCELYRADLAQVHSRDQFVTCSSRWSTSCTTRIVS